MSITPNNSLTLFRDSLKSRLTLDAVYEIIESLGIEISRNKSFMLHSESTPSSRVNPRTLNIKDFGGEFSGDILALVEDRLNIDFISSLNYAAPFVSMEEFTKNSTVSIPKPLPIRQDKQNTQPTYDLSAIKTKHKKDLSQESAYKGLLELYPCLTMDKSLLQFLGFSKYYNSLTIELPGVSAVRNANGTKWKTYGSKKVTPCKINAADEYVFLYSGMAEIVAMELMELSYIGLQSDSMDGYLSKEIINQTKNKTVVIIEEDDESESSQKLSQRLVQKFNKTKIVNIGQAMKKGVNGFDLRDLINDVNSFDIAKMLITSFAQLAPLQEKPEQPVQEEIKINYSGKYITNQDVLDISSLKNGVITALTGSGKTYSFENKPDTLILVPRVIQTNVYKGDKTEFLINKIMDSGATITYEKFVGHYRNSSSFREYASKIKIVVDEAHTLLSNVKEEYSIIFNLDAIFLSGTIESFFREDLQHYKFIPEQKKKMYYTEGKIPNFKNALYFVDHAKALMKNYSNNCVVGSHHEFKNINVHNASGQVFATSALREGISINHNNFDACIVAAAKCNTWSVKDIIQGLQRPRNEALRIVTKKIENEKKKHLTVDYFMKQAEYYASTREINTIMGEFYSKFIKFCFKPNSYILPSIYGVTCFLYDLTKNYYDTELYEFEEYKEAFETLEINTKTKEELGNKEEGLIKLNGVNVFYDKSSVKRVMKWQQLEAAGVVNRLYKKKGQVYSLKYLYAVSDLGKEVKKQFNKIFQNNKYNYSIDKFLTLIRESVKVEMFDPEGNEIKRVRGVNLNDISIKIVGVCPVNLKLENGQTLEGNYLYTNNLLSIATEPTNTGIIDKLLAGQLLEEKQTEKQLKTRLNLNENTEYKFREGNTDPKSGKRNYSLKPTRTNSQTTSI